MRNRRWAIVAGLGIVELWIVGLMLRSVAGYHDVPASALAMGAASSARAIDGSVRTIEAGRAPHVVIDTADSALSVSVQSGINVTVRESTRRSGWVHAAGRPVTLERTGDGVRIVRTGSNLTLLVGSFSRQLDVVVPPQTNLEVRNAGSTSISGLRGAAMVHSDDGTVRLTDQRGVVHVVTDNGRIELRDVEAPDVEAVSGDGPIAFDRVRADQVTATTDDGRIDIGSSILGAGKIATDSGSIALGLDPQSDVTVDAHADSGHVTAESPLATTRGGEDDADGATLVRVGSGAGRLHVSSDSGSIRIRRGD